MSIVDIVDEGEFRLLRPAFSLSVGGITVDRIGGIPRMSLLHRLVAYDAGKAAPYRALLGRALRSARQWNSDLHQSCTECTDEFARKCEKSGSASRFVRRRGLRFDWIAGLAIPVLGVSRSHGSTNPAGFRTILRSNQLENNALTGKSVSYAIGVKT